MWIIVRHGTRNPGDDDIKEMAVRGPQLVSLVLKAHKEGKGELCKADLERLEKWKFDLKPENEKLLTNSGREELKTMGERYRKRFPGLLDMQFDKEKYLVSSGITFFMFASNVAFR